MGRYHGVLAALVGLAILGAAGSAWADEGWRGGDRGWRGGDDRGGDDQGGYGGYGGYGYAPPPIAYSPYGYGAPAYYPPPPPVYYAPPMGGWGGGDDDD